MRLVSLSVNAWPPISKFEVANLGDIVVLAGPNGVGKTSLLNVVLRLFQAPGHDQQKIVASVAATNEAEVTAWSKSVVDTSNPQDAATLRSFLGRNQKRGQLRSGVLNFDSSRVFENIQPYSFNWNFNDPFLEDLGSGFFFSSARQRFQDVIHALYRKIRSQKEEIAANALKLQREGGTSMALNFPDPILKFKQAFSKLLPGKALVDLDEQNQQLRYTVGKATLPFEALSSGEREVVTVVFDFLLRDPQDSVIVFDEPELHLHPELSYRLLRTLREVGERNQFIFSTHSADIISASLDQSVIFVSPAKEDRNQAIVIGEDNEAARILHALGQSAGVISLGRKIVLIEGTDSSLDKQTYGAILGDAANELVLVPAGGKDQIHTFLTALDTVLNKTVWGIDFYMVCDGDSNISVEKSKSHPRLRRLGRYHLENCFLDEECLARTFATIGEPEDSKLRDPNHILFLMRETAMERIAHAAALRVSHQIRTEIGNVDVMPSDVHGMDCDSLTQAFAKRCVQEGTRTGTYIAAERIAALVSEEYKRISESLRDGKNTWKFWIPGKPILNTLASKANVDLTRLKTVYIRESKSMQSDPFLELRKIFAYFVSHSSTETQVVNG